MAQDSERKYKGYVVTRRPGKLEQQDVCALVPRWPSGEMRKQCLSATKLNQGPTQPSHAFHTFLTFGWNQHLHRGGGPTQLPDPMGHVVNHGQRRTRPRCFFGANGQVSQSTFAPSSGIIDARQRALAKITGPTNLVLGTNMRNRHHQQGPAPSTTDFNS